MRRSWPTAAYAGELGGLGGDGGLELQRFLLAGESVKPLEAEGRMKEGGAIDVGHAPKHCQRRRAGRAPPICGSSPR